jgi:serine/threonine protein kinase HipA of HipAB toxin-antitoxin module
LPIGPNPQGIDLSTSVENEWLCAQIVAGFGIPVARCSVEQFGEQPALVVERFDRRLAADGKWFMRLPQEDFCQATATAPALKYESDGGQVGRQPPSPRLRRAREALALLIALLVHRLELGVEALDQAAEW